MDDEIFIVVVVAIIAGTVMITTLIRSILAYASRKDRPSGESSLSMSELEAMLHRAVESGTEPLAARLDALEDRLLDAPHEPTVQEAFDAEERASVPRSAF